MLSLVVFRFTLFVSAGTAATISCTPGLRFSEAIMGLVKSVILFAIALAFLPGSPAVAQTPPDRLPVERVQRELQSRRRYLGVPASDFAWKGCTCSGSSAPAMPPDGYYPDSVLGDATCMAAIVGQIRSAFYDVVDQTGDKRWLKESAWNLEGRIDFVNGEGPNEAYYGISDFSIDAVTTSNFASVLAQIQSYLPTLSRFARGATTEDAEAVSSWVGGSITNIAIGPCPSGIPHINDCFVLDCGCPEDICEIANQLLDTRGETCDTDYVWHDAPLTTVPTFRETHVLTLNDQNADCEEPCDGDLFFSWQAGQQIAKIKVGAEAHHPDYAFSATVYGAATLVDGVDGPGPSPIPVDDALHGLASVTGVGAATPSDWIAKKEPTGLLSTSLELTCDNLPPITCTQFQAEEYFEFDLGWQLKISLGMTAVLVPEWQLESDSGLCDGSTVSDPRTAANTDQSEGKADALACGDPGFGSPAGGPGGLRSRLPGAGGAGGNGKDDPGSGPSMPNRCYGTMDFPPSSSCPVDLPTGDKFETVTDIAVAMPGRTFTISRQYSSRPDYAGAGLVGQNWTASCFGFVDFDAGTGTVRMEGFGARHHLIYSGSGGVWRSGGPTTQTMTQTSVTIDGASQNVWRLEEPGAWSIDFYRGGDFDGLIRQDRDLFGNTCTFEYILFDPTDTKRPRLSAIYLNGTEGDGGRAGFILFKWYLPGGSDPNHGRLQSIIAYQPDASGALVQTQRVDYAYHGSGGITAPTLGTSGDLVQVTKWERVDRATTAAAPYRQLVTQYRYFGDYTAASGSDERLTSIAGDDHQLRLIIQPEQIEYLASELVPSHGSWTPATIITETANYLLDKLDSDDAYSGAGRKVIDYASKVVSYESSGLQRVSRQYLQGGCGCSGGGSHGIRASYEYLGTSSDPTVVVTEYTLSGGSYSSLVQTVRFDMATIGSGGTTSVLPYLRNLVVEGPDSRRWIWRYEYDATNHDLELVYWPSAMRGTYTAATSTTAASIAPSSTGGRVVEYSYTTSGGGHRLAGIALRNAATSSPAFVPVTAFTYDSTRPWLLTKIERFTTDASSPTADQIETTDLDYGWRTGTDNLAWLKATVEAETVGENGPGGSYASYELFDQVGENVWSVDRGGTLMYRKFDPGTGRLLKAVRNADPTGPDGDRLAALIGANYAEVTTTGWGTVNDGGELVSSYKHDALGRVIERTAPGGVMSYTVRELWADNGTVHAELERAGVNYLAEISLPHKFASEYNDPPSGQSVWFDGPASVSVYSAGGRVIQSGDYTLSTSGTYDPGALSFTLATEIARTTTQHNYLGLATSRLRWHDVAGNKSYTTTYTYDSIGRLKTTFEQAGTSGSDKTGTFTTNESYDVFDRVLEVKIGGGIETGSPTMTTVAEYFYDHGGTESSPTQGTGDGYLTLVRQWTQEPTSVGYSSPSRTTVRTFDERGRLAMTKNPLPPHEYLVYDNLNRVTHRGLFKSVPTVGSGSGVGIDSSDRGLYVETKYSQRGMVYKQRVAVDPGDLGDGYLETNRWFDGDGRTVAEWAPNSPGRKSVFDAHGRTTAAYITDRDGDAAPGASGTYADATALASDRVLEQTEYRYSDADRLELITTRRRVPDFTGTGDLDQPAVSGVPAAVVTYTGYDYDTALRRTHTINFGTNISADVFESGGLEPSWPPPSPVEPNEESGPYASALISQTRYNARGLPSVMTDPAGKHTHLLYDDLSRRIATVENIELPDPEASVTGFPDSNISWSSSGGRWQVTAGLSASLTDQNRVTSFVYDGMGHTVKQVAHYPDPSSSAEKVQVTQYVYGVDTTTSPVSLLSSYDLLREVHYPDESTGEAGTTSAYKVIYSYNALGELRTVTDQNQTVHTYHRDDAGRVLHDVVTLPGGSPIDSLVDQIDVEYDALGRLDTAKSLDSTTVVNAVQFKYTPLWQVEHVYQDPHGDLTFSGGTPTGTTKAVTYSYATSTSANYSRLSALAYPDGSNAPYDYGDSGEINDRISRVEALKLDGLTGASSHDTLAAYTYVGLDMPSVVDYATADVQLDRTFSHEGKRYSAGKTTQTAGSYPGWDRFGRVKRQAWIDGALDADSHGNLPTRPPAVEEAYAYDKASNRIDRQDARPGVKWTNTDNQYDYDGLDRLEEARKGKYDASQTWTLAASSQQWSLDMLGNWAEIVTDANANGAYDSSETEERTHDAANQLTERDPPGLFSYPLAYDDAGNITSSKQTSTQTRQYVHDAWNRLVRVKLYKQTVPATTIRLADYRYNPLHWRVLAQVDTNPGGNGIDQQRAMYYSAGWQLVQEDIDDFTNCNPDASGGGCTPTPDGINRRAQEFWGLRYIDDPVLRRIGQGTSGWLGANDQAYYHLTDAQFSTVAMITAVGSKLVERVDYTPYGVGSHKYGHDVNGDGAVTTSTGTAGTDGYLVDQLASAGGGAGTDMVDGSGDLVSTYDVAADIDRDGEVDSADLSLLTTWGAKSALSAGVISEATGPDNLVGYDGYVFVPEHRSYCVRFRWYEPVLGRWMQRDPIRYADGALMYLYTADSPVVANDPSGLIAQPGTGGVADGRFDRSIWYCYTYGDSEQVYDKDTDTIFDEYDVYRTHWLPFSKPEYLGRERRARPDFDRSDVLSPPDPNQCVCDDAANKKSDADRDMITGSGNELAGEARGVVISGTALAAGKVLPICARVIRAAKPGNLPGWGNVCVDWEHIFDGHMVGGARAAGTKKTLFPDGWTQADVKRAVRDAYDHCELKRTQGPRKLLVGRTCDGHEIEMWINTKSRAIETAYPVPRKK